MSLGDKMNSDNIEIIKDKELYKAILRGTLGIIPIVGGIVVELWNYVDARMIDRRLKVLEDTIYQQHIDITDFKKKLVGVTDDEHKFYAVRNNLKHMLLSALPETVDALNKALIELVMSENYDMSEHVCEIIQQLNADDIYFLKLIISFQKEGKNDHQLKVTLEAQQAVIKQQESMKAAETNSGYKKNFWMDRNVQFEKNTIFWIDFAQFFGLSKNVKDPSILFNSYCSNKEGNTIIEWAYVVRSLTKLQGLGVLVCEINITAGTSSLANIDRFHLSFFGQKILSYLDNYNNKLLDS